MEIITEYLIEKGYEIEHKTINQKDRGKFEYVCEIDKKPIEEDVKEMEEIFGIKILKNNFRKGKELRMLIRKIEEEKEEQKEEVKRNLNIDEIVEFIYNNNLSREELRNLLNMFQNISYTKGYKSNEKI